MRIDHYESGALYGVRYHFQAGERLPMHLHAGDEADQAHNIVVLKGTVEFKGMDRRILVAGDIFDFDGSQPHEIAALEESITLHLMLAGRPAAYPTWTDAHKHGEA